MNKNFKSKLVAGLMTTAMIFSSAAAFAPVYAVSGTQTKFTKYLKVEQGANAPAASFEFTVSAGVAKEASDTTQKINAGINPIDVIVGQAIFSKDSNKTENATGVSADGKQIFFSNVEVNFSKIDFPQAGIYRYLITEQAPTSSYFTKDRSTKVLDVYIQRNTDTNQLEVQGYVLHADQNADITKGTNLTNSGKGTGFVNEYKSHDLTIEKKSSGNQANPDDEFQFTLVVNHANPNTTLAVETTSNDTKTQGSIETKDGNFTKVITLKANQTYKIIGLNEGASYQLEETDKNHYSLEKVDVTGSDVTNNKDTSPVSVVKADNIVDDDSLTGDVTITFNNRKDGTVPTGIIFAVAPFAVGAVVLAAFIIVKMRRTAKQ